LRDLQEYVSNNKWIKLNSHGYIHIRNGYKFIPEEAEIQTCTIISIKEMEDYQEQVDKKERNDKIKQEIIDKILQYEFNLRLKLWFFYRTFYLEERDLSNFNNEFLREVLNKCEKYKCEHRRS
jgi:hypothetical protein